MNYFKFLFVTALLLESVSSGLTLITLQNPFADIDKLGTVINLGQSIEIPSTNGLITIEYSAPTKRRIVWKGESREINLHKSSILNGIYNDDAKLEPGPIGDICCASYSEVTVTFSSKEEYERYFASYNEALGFRHNIDSRLVVRAMIGEKGHKKCFFIRVHKYLLKGTALETETETGSSMRGGASPE